MQFKDYIQGHRRGKEANRFEREALNDPFLQEALEGIDAVPGNHAEIIERLSKRVTNPARANITNVTHRKKDFYYWSIAASILLLIGFGIYFLIGKNDEISTIVMLQSDKSDDSLAAMEMIAPLSPEISELPEAPVLQEQSTARRAVTIPDVAEAKIEVDNILVEEIDFSSEDEVFRVAEVFAPVTTGVMKREEPATVSQRQEKATFSAQVIDETGNPLPGVRISVKGSSNGVQTDANGFFELDILENDSVSLVTSYLGYTPKEIAFSDKNQTITLQEDTQALNEIVVVAYGTQKKEAVIGSIAKTDVYALKATDEQNLHTPFGKKEFLAFCKQNVRKNICGSKSVSVTLSFYIDESGKPTRFNFTKFTCEAAKKEIETLLSTSPPWTTTNQSIKMTIKW